MTLHTTEVFSPDQLIAGNANLLLADPIIISAGQNLPRGAVLGRVTATGEYVLCAAHDGGEPPTAITDGSEAPLLILAESVDATSAPTQALGYKRGDFLASQVTLGPGHTVASIAPTLRALGIFLV